MDVAKQLQLLNRKMYERVQSWMDGWMGEWIGGMKAKIIDIVFDCYINRFKDEKRNV